MGVMPPEVMSMQDISEVGGAVPSVLAEGRYITFGPFQVDQHRQEVSRSGTKLKLQGKVYQILLALLEKPGEVVTREELRMRLWPAETHVNYDANVNTTVNKLRQALGDSSEKPIYIETIPRKGYCLLMQPEFSDKPLVPALAASPEEITAETLEKPRSLWPSRSDLWLALGVLGLILAGMLIGAGITRLWLSHFAQSADFFF